MTTVSADVLKRLGQHGRMAERWFHWRASDPERLKDVSTTQIFSSPRRFPADDFTKFLCALDRSQSIADIEVLVEHFRSDIAECVQSQGVSALTLLFLIMPRGRGLQVSFRRGMPTVAGGTGTHEDWAKLIGTIDPDAMACAELVHQTSQDRRTALDTDTFRKWPLHFGPDDTDLQKLLARGVSDVHIHMKSLTSVAVNWQRLLVEERTLEKSFHAKNAKKRSRQEAADARRERDFIISAIAEIGATRRREARSAVDLCFRTEPSARSGRRQNKQRPRFPREILAPYRKWLFDQWRRVELRSGGSGEKRPDDDLERRLGNYLLAKMIFRSRHLQDWSNTNTGLKAFDIFRKRGSHLARFHRDEADGKDLNLRNFFLNNGLLVTTLTDDPAVRRADLRIAPPEVEPSRLARSYAQTGRGLHDLFAPHRDTGVDLSTSVHFKRFIPLPKTSDRGRKRGRPASEAVLNKLKEFDKETAGFQQMRVKLAQRKRNKESYAPALEAFRRIDLASPERGAEPGLIAPFIRLLRGNPSARDQLRNLPRDCPYAVRWQRLERHGYGLVPLSEPTIRMVCHAGEDFDTVAQGLMHIDRAIETWELEVGDGLGHALALGGPILDETSYNQELVHKRLTRGNDLDSLIWLLDFVEENALFDEPLRATLERAVRSLARQIYAGWECALGIYEEICSPDLMKERLAAADRLPPVGPAFDVKRFMFIDSARAIRDVECPAGEKLRLADLFVDGIAERRQEIVPPDNVHKPLREGLRQVQTKIVEKIKRRGLVIETNPSSNVRMRRCQWAADLPLVELMADRDGPRITIGSDNPGTYDTTICNEYGLLFSALRNSQYGLSRDDALERLEQMRQTGMSRINWDDVGPEHT